MTSRQTTKHILTTAARDLADKLLAVANDDGYADDERDHAATLATRLLAMADDGTFASPGGQS